MSLKLYSDVDVQNIANAIRGKGYRKLPITYQEVEYIESHGTEYIDTNFIANNNTSLEFDYQMTNYSSRALLFQVGSSINKCSMYTYSMNGNSVMLATTVGGDPTRGGFSVDDCFVKNHYLFTVNGIWVNGEKRNSRERTFTNTDENLFILGRTSWNGIQGKTYSWKIYDNNTLVRDFIPCYRKSDNVIGLYDLVNGVFYTNAGTGTFLKGNNVNSPLKLSEMSGAINNLPITTATNGTYNAGALLRNYKVFGNSTQGENPSPSNPQAITSVGDKTKNLFDKNSVSVGKNWNGAVNTICYPFTDQNTRAVMLIPAKPNTNYFIKMYKTNWYCMQILLANNSYTVINSFGYLQSDTVDLAIPTSSDTAYIGIKFKYGNDGTTVITSDMLNELKIQLEEGSTATTYEPYGYKIPVKVSGKNKYNPDNVQSVNSATLVKTTTGFNITRTHGSGYGDEFIAVCSIDNLLPNETYTFNLDVESENFFNNYSIYTYSDNLFGTALTKSNYVASEKNRKWNITTNLAGKIVIGIYAGTTAINKVYEFTNIQLEESSSATPYEPYHTPIATDIYLDEPLRGTTEKDLITYSTQERTNKIKKVTLSAGTHTLSDAKNNGNYKCTQQEAGTLTGQVLTLNAGVSNADVIYELATPTEESVVLPQIDFWKGTNIVEIGTSVQATQEITYIS